MVFNLFQLLNLVMSKLNLVSKTINIMVNIIANIMVQTIGYVKIAHLNELCKLTHFCVFSNTSFLKFIPTCT